jgi:transposase InsO family protein
LLREALRDVRAFERLHDLFVEPLDDRFGLDWLIPLSELHLRSVLKAWMTHYNEARPHMALGPVSLIRQRSRRRASVQKRIRSGSS